ncbi:hypothetical protein QBC46DRAFT_367640 [Diplogelasinospora grovesii]|uniref:JmjC domain-containing protein n=1 Tax=Diplogelasinospora grovesii TaxID=303347 RepID=A0AAN6S0K0_9PEZI|nr:hypothetical protein QBC46DRAFT_367640 [Diplogelasinospora grovesii]
MFVPKATSIIKSDSQVDRFRYELRRETGTERYDLCVQKRDELLDQHTGLQILIAACEHVMSTECPEYRQRKQTKDRDTSQPLPASKEDDVARWHRFLGVATDGSRMKSECLTALKEVVRCWGRDIVQHYQWASKGEKYWNQLRTTARKVHMWDQAVVGLNWAILQRSRNIKRRPVKASVNPIEQADLERLRTWSYEDPFPCQRLAPKDLPSGFGFYKFGLIVYKEYAVVLPEPDNSRAILSIRRATLPSTPSALRHTDSGHCICPETASIGVDHPVRRRTASLPDINQHISKRLRFDMPPSSPSTLMVSSDIARYRPVHDRMADDTYRRRVLAELLETSGQGIPSRNSHGEETDELLRKLLEKVEQPNTDSSQGMVDAFFCTGDEAASLVETGSSRNAPIITQGQQQFRWSNGERPIAQLFRRMGGLDKSVSVQIPSRKPSTKSFAVRKLSVVWERFLNQEATRDPWNILDLQSPLPQSILPNFLTGENCQLLLLVRNTVLMENSAERVVASTKEWNEWKNVLEWVLISEGGHNTAPHIDSHGFGTWLTGQEEGIGFGWMSSPTSEEREAWMADPNGYTSGRWIYVVLKPGKSLYFPPGTIHFVFRVRSRQTLALGGHVLQWSGIQRWMQVVLAQMRNPAITNEDMKSTAPKLVRVVAKLVSTRVEESGVEEVGGEAAVADFFASVKVILSRPCKTEC